MPLIARHTALSHVAHGVPKDLGSIPCIINVYDIITSPYSLFEFLLASLPLRKRSDFSQGCFHSAPPSCRFPAGSGGYVLAFPSLRTRDPRGPGALQPDQQTIKCACGMYPTNNQKPSLRSHGSCSSKTSTVKGRKIIIFSVQ